MPRITIGRPRSLLQRFLAWLCSPPALVKHCPRCHEVLHGDPEMQRRSARRCSRYTVCVDGTGERCRHLEMVWS